MLRFEVFTVKALALLMATLLLALSVSSTFSASGQLGMTPSSSAYQTLNLSMDHDIDHGSMNITADVGCSSGGVCCMESCGQSGVVSSGMAHLLPSNHYFTLPTRNKLSHFLGAIYRPPRLTA